MKAASQKTLPGKLSQAGAGKGLGSYPPKSVHHSEDREGTDGRTEEAVLQKRGEVRKV